MKTVEQHLERYSERIKNFSSDLKSSQIASTGILSSSIRDRVESIADQESDSVEKPDEHYGMDYTFIKSFITKEMRPAFRTAALQFLKEEQIHPDPDHSHLLSQLIYPFRMESCFDDSLDFRLLSMILICAEHGSLYCRELLITLYKTYYKQEYNVLKRMKSLSFDQYMEAFCDINAIFDDALSKDEEEALSDTLARVFVMSEMLNIDLDESWYGIVTKDNQGIFDHLTMWKAIIYASMDRSIKEKEQKNADNYESWLIGKFPGIEWASLTDNAPDKRFRILKQVYDIIEHAFDRNNASTKPVYGETPFDLVENARRAMGLYNNSERIDDVSQVLLISVINYLSEMLAKSISLRDYELNELLRIGIRDFLPVEEMEEAFKNDFDAEQATTASGLLTNSRTISRDQKIERVLKSLQSLKQKKVTPETKPKVISPAIITDDNASKIDELQERVNALEQQLSSTRSQLQRQRELYEESRMRTESLERRLRERGEEHTEVIALRNHVYAYSEETSEEEEHQEPDMIAELQKHKVLIVGGHENWIKKMKRIFPEWNYLGARDGLGVNGAVASCERMFFYTDILGHSMYQKFLKAAAEYDKPFSYLHGTNINTVVRTLYRTLVEEAD